MHLLSSLLDYVPYTTLRFQCRPGKMHTVQKIIPESGQSKCLAQAGVFLQGFIHSLVLIIVSET